MTDQTYKLDIDQDGEPEPMPQAPPLPQNQQAQPDVEVPFEQVVAENEPAPEPEVKKEEDVLDVLVPKSEPKTWEIGPENVRRTYVQRPLGFFTKMQWFSLVGDAMDKALSGPNKMSLGGLLSAPGSRGGTLSMEDFRDADTFVQAIAKLIAVAPDFLADSYCIWLAVPDYEREMVKEIMALPEQDGGLSDEDALEMIEIFIDQNYDALATFFTERLGQLQKRVQARLEARRDSKPSASSRP